MSRRRKETFVSTWIVGVAIITAILYATMTILFWLAVIAVGGALIYLTYLLTTEVEWFENRIAPTILAYSATILIILFWGSEILSNYGAIDKSFRNSSIEWAQNTKLLKGNKGNFKITPDYKNIAESGVSNVPTPAPDVPSEEPKNTGIFGWLASFGRSIFGGLLSPFSTNK